ncbi:hypothetical protein CRN79_03485 [Serratia fonticola]|uniref:hypothetical protein n=1 Tax=Serratia fonticola TaxID=47917 RepID=UPI000BFD276C|nr:hypothetical protein [Serratia fonticola]ATM74964.1 hypothetical protein CRN79_03485 [Serratia fonticola]
MKIKKSIFIALILMLFAFTPRIIMEFDNYRDDHFSCWGRINFYEKNIEYSAQVKYTFNGGKGILNSRGELTYLGGRTRKIHQNLIFKYTHSGDEIIMVSTQSALSDEQAKSLDNILPDFYLYKDRGLRIRIFNQGHNGYVFVTSGIPIFLCTKTQ